MYDLQRKNFWGQNHDKVLVKRKNRIFLGSGIREKLSKNGGGWVPVIFNKFGVGGGPDRSKIGGGGVQIKVFEVRDQSFWVF